MAPMSNLNMSNIAITTIVCTWIFTILTILSMAFQVKWTLLHGKFLATDNVLIILGFGLCLALVGQITWAVLDEEQGQHISDVEENKLDVMGKVCALFIL
jgi:hypothetical protein